MDKILIVDDVKLLREIQKGLLSSSRVHIFSASDGLEALEVARKEIPNLVVMDNHMPVMDGVTCCREIKKDPLLKHIPVIMLTNATKGSDSQEYRDAGCSACLAKPIDSRQYLSTLKKYIPAIECRGVRIPICMEVGINNGLHAGTTKDISLKGINITSEFHPAPGDEIRFSFVLPGSDSSTEVRGKVAWVRKKESDVKPGASFEFGVEFIEITGKGMPFIRKGELEAFVSKHSGAV